MEELTCSRKASIEKLYIHTREIHCKTLAFLEINNFLQVVLHQNHSHLLEKMLHFQDDHNHPKKLAQDKGMSVQEM